MLLTDALISNGYAVVPDVVTAETVASLVEAMEHGAPGSGALRRGTAVYGARNLLRENPAVRALADSETVRSLVESVLGTSAFAVRGLFFDKTPSANWPVAWHQDRTIAVREKHDVPGFGPWTVKAGVPHVQPPPEILENMLTVRVHLDECDETNGPLQVVAGSHRGGFLDNEAIRSCITDTHPVSCLVPRGGAVLMRPLLVHCSARATRPHHRRVVHLEFAARLLPGGLEWFEH
ncbi:MAG TPA: phytanoyl-CoA dioxygenase family protein [Verrucomicrobiae bacterium]|nr:phytanoyl-CoA dioxygenase family protein [Verrucomicrobiae bacterium]